MINCTIFIKTLSNNSDISAIILNFSKIWAAGSFINSNNSLNSPEIIYKIDLSENETN